MEANADLLVAEYNKGLENGRKVGIREVVEWIKEECYLKDGYYWLEEEALLKEWGV